MSQIDKVTAANNVNHSQAFSGVPFQDMKQTAKSLGLSYYYIRQLKRDGKLPGIYNGNIFLVNVPLLLESLNASSEEVLTNEQR